VKKKRAMDEQSQIDAMRAAVRGDLERARSRRGGTLLQPDRSDDPEQEHVPDPAPEAEEPAPAVSGAVAAEPVSEAEPVAIDEPEPVAVEEPAPEPEPPAVDEAPQRKRGFFFWRR
jgi:hypothetical protein